MEGFSPSMQKSTLFGAPFFLDVYTFLFLHLLANS